MRKRAVPLFKERHFTMIIQNGKFEKPVWQGENDNKKLGDKRDVKTLRTPSGQEYQIDMSYREWALLFLLVQDDWLDYQHFIDEAYRLHVTCAHYLSCQCIFESLFRELYTTYEIENDYIKVTFEWTYAYKDQIKAPYGRRLFVSRNTSNEN
tara:strand:- start:542264 stop:542719 length:456 start_codon:yes stop_codon:yes gene_type:complete